MVLTTVTTSRVQEYDILISLARLLIEDLASAPHGRLDIDVASNDAVLVELLLRVLGRGASKGIVEEFQYATPDVRPAGE